MNRKHQLEYLKENFDLDIENTDFLLKQFEAMNVMRKEPVTLKKFVSILSGLAPIINNYKL